MYYLIFFIFILCIRISIFRFIRKLTTVHTYLHIQSNLVLCSAICVALFNIHHSFSIFRWPGTFEGILLYCFHHSLLFSRFTFIAAICYCLIQSSKIKIFVFLCITTRTAVIQSTKLYKQSHARQHTPSNQQSIAHCICSTSIH